MGGQVVLQVQRTFQAGLLDQRQTKNRSGLLVLDIPVPRELVRSRSIVQYNIFLRSDDVAEDGLGQFVRRRKHLAEIDRNSVATGGCFRFNSRLVALEKNESSALGADAFERDD